MVSGESAKRALDLAFEITRQIAINLTMLKQINALTRITRHTKFCIAYASKLCVLCVIALKMNHQPENDYAHCTAN